MRSDGAGWRGARALLLACHPVPTAAVTGLALAMSIAVGHDTGRVLLIGAAVLSGQLSIGWCNDAIDAVRDERSGRRDKPVALGLVSRRTVEIAAGTALASTVVLSMLVGVVPGGVHLVTVAGGWAYDLGLKRTALSWLPYAVAFAALPCCVVLAGPGTPAPPWWLGVAGGLLGVGAHFANTLPDLEDDLATGVHGLPHRLGRRQSAAGAAVLLALASVLLVLAPDGRPTWVATGGLVLVLGTAAAVAYVGWTRPASRWPLLGVVAVAGIDVVLLVLGVRQG